MAKQNYRKLANRTTAFLDSITCLPFNDAASGAAAGVRLELEAKGKGIGAYDMLIAGHCLALAMSSSQETFVNSRA